MEVALYEFQLLLLLLLLNIQSWNFNIGMKQLKGILNVATGFKGIKESTHKSQINNKKYSGN